MIRIFDTISELNKGAAELFLQSALKAIKEKGQFTVALTGGSSPAGLYELLSTPAYSRQIDWSKTYVFWGDERWVPLTDDRSNAKMAFNTLLSRVPIPGDNVFPMYHEHLSPGEYAAEYEKLLKKYLNGTGFDLILLGMGEDGHTASLFPDTQVLHEQSKWVVSYFLSAQDMYRITLTVPAINMAEKIAVILFGAKKAESLHQVIEGERAPQKLPAQLLNPVKGELIWLTDKDAASKLTRE